MGFIMNLEDIYKYEYGDQYNVGDKLYLEYDKVIVLATSLTLKNQLCLVKSDNILKVVNSYELTVEPRKPIRNPLRYLKEY